MLFCLYYLVQLLGGGILFRCENHQQGIMLCKASIWGLLWFEGPTTTDFSYFLPISIGLYIVKVDPIQVLWF
jgi:hypothetical protein